MFRDFFFLRFLPPCLLKFDRRAFFIYDRRVDVNNLSLSFCAPVVTRIAFAYGFYSPAEAIRRNFRPTYRRTRPYALQYCDDTAQRLPQPVAITELETRHDGRTLARACKRRSALQRPRDRCRINIDLVSLHVSVGQVRPTEWLGRKVHTAVERV